MNFKTTTTLIISICIFASCYRIDYEKKELKNKNPTKYCFDYSLNMVKMAIDREFSYSKFEEPTRWQLITKDSRFMIHDETEKILHKVENKNDVVIKDYRVGYLGDKSYIYTKNNKFLPYSVNFHLNVDSISKTKTCVEVIPINPRIEIGVFHWLVPHSWTFEYDRYIDAESSSIEEYEILFKIGQFVGQKDMPAIIYPDSTCTIKKLSYYSIARPWTEAELNAEKKKSQ